MKFSEKQGLEQYIRGSSITTSPRKDQQVLDAALKAFKDKRQIPVRMKPWRHTMKTCSKIAAVLIIVIVLASFLFPTRHGLVPGSVALAEVQAALAAYETIFASGTRILTSNKVPAVMPPAWKQLLERPEGDEGPVRLTLHSETYISSKGYANRVYDTNGVLLADASLHYETGLATFLVPSLKVYFQFEVSEAQRAAMSGFTIQGFINMLYQSGDSRELDPRDVKGIQAVGFEVTDWQARIFGEAPEMFHALLNIQRATARAWIDPKTKLPVQTENECDLNGSVITFFQPAHLSVIDDTFEWGIPMDETLFQPDIPEDYQPLPLFPAKP